MIEQLKRITHVLGHIVQPSSVVELDTVSDWIPKALAIGVCGDVIYIAAETESADALTASVTAVLGNEYEIEPIASDVVGCVALWCSKTVTDEGDTDAVIE